MKAVGALLLVASASAFAPATVNTPSSTTALAAKLDSAFGVGIEFGNKAPPLAAWMLEDASPAATTWFQNSEIKHGRIAMIATIGFLTQKLGVHFPLYFGPTGSNAFHPESVDSWYLSSSAGVTFSDIAHAAPLDAIAMVPFAGWVQIFAVAGWFECIAYNRQWAEGRAIPGDYGYDPLGFTKREGGWASPELTKLRLNEIKNGRLAMYVYIFDSDGRDTFML